MRVSAIDASRLVAVSSSRSCFRVWQSRITGFQTGSAGMEFKSEAKGDGRFGGAAAPEVLLPRDGIPMFVEIDDHMTCREDYTHAHYTVYKLIARCDGAEPNSWAVYRRYSDFRCGRVGAVASPSLGSGLPGCPAKFAPEPAPSLPPPPPFIPIRRSGNFRTTFARSAAVCPCCRRRSPSAR